MLQCNGDAADSGDSTSSARQQGEGDGRGRCSGVVGACVASGGRSELGEQVDLGAVLRPLFLCVIIHRILRGVPCGGGSKLVVPRGCPRCLEDDRSATLYASAEDRKKRRLVEKGVGEILTIVVGSI